jgi:hypothetical protein
VAVTASCVVGPNSGGLACNGSMRARAFYTIAQLAMSTAAKTPKNAGAASAAVPRSANV